VSALPPSTKHGPCIQRFLTMSWSYHGWRNGTPLMSRWRLMTRSWTDDASCDESLVEQ
jgi:hypothetical protein